MPTLAFYKHKKGAAGLLDDLMRGLCDRLKPAPQPQDFAEFMKALQNMSSGENLRYTDEALELLKWIRQFVDAVDTRP